MSDGYLVTPVWGPRGGCLMAPCLLLSPSPPANGLEEDNTKGTSSSPQGLLRSGTKAADMGTHTADYHQGVGGSALVYGSGQLVG